MKQNIALQIGMVVLLQFVPSVGKEIPSETPIDDLSKKSLFISIIRNDVVVCHATGFLVKWKNKPYLVTNWHVVTGHHPLDPAEYAELKKPDSIRIIHHSKTPGIWINQGAEAIFNSDGSPRYFEHPEKWVDVVVLPLNNYDSILHKLYFYETDQMKLPVKMMVGMPVFIIGFLQGLAGPGVFPLWKAGNIASEPNLKYQGNNAFLIDASTRGGMSGSPVICKEFNNNGKAQFLGIYAGRLSQDSEIGLVWTPENIFEILETIE